MNKTTNRATPAGLGGALTVLLLWLAELQPSAEVVVALTLVITVGIQVLWARFDLGKYIGEHVEAD